jgi:ribonuclease HI
MVRVLNDVHQHKSLILNVDGGCEPKNPGGIATCGWVLFDGKNKVLADDYRVVRDGGPLATNNFAEYCALGLALRWLKEQNWRGNLLIRADSKLLVEQVNERWKCKAEHLIPLRERIWELMQGMELNLGVNCHLEWVSREENAYADELTGRAYQEYQKKKNENRQNQERT